MFNKHPEYLPHLILKGEETTGINQRHLT